MAGRERTYICIDLKSFYASVERTDRGLDPFATDLVVADPERSANTICLAVTPSMKAKGVRNRCRVRDIPAGMEYITAVPRMRRYMEVSAEIYREYLRFVCAEDAWPYSVDECFIDATPYLRRYGLSARTFAGRLIAAGCTTLVVIQMLLNVAGVIGIFPLSGKPIPFVSYGGPSVIASLMLAIATVAIVNRLVCPTSELPI